MINFFAKIEDALKQISFPNTPTKLYAPICYALESGGKRIRSQLTLLCANLFLDDIEKTHLSAALAIELFHTFTLIHDDIMDQAK
ncbi:MAG: polyprenyl synthetase family protein, partial [Bacteroidales bacterium]